MKKTILSFITGALLFGTVGVFAGQYTVTVNPFPIQLNGKEVNIEGYNINDNTYFKLRDISSIIGGFDVDFNKNTILLSKDGYHYCTAKEYIQSKLTTDDFGIGSCRLDVKDHSFEVLEADFGGAPHIGGSLYIDGKLFEESVHPFLWTDNEYIYYVVDGIGWNGIYKLDINTLEKKELIKTDEDHGISTMYNEYLYSDGDYTSKFLICNLETDKIVADIPGDFICITKDEKLLYSVENNVYKSNLDGSNPQLVTDKYYSHMDDSYLYFIDYLEELGEEYYRMQVKRINIETLEIENVTDVYEAGYVIFGYNEKTITFGTYGVDECITVEYD